MKEKIINLLIGIVIGIAITLIIFKIPKIRYDLNNDGEVDISDLIYIRNYILEN